MGDNIKLGPLPITRLALPLNLCFEKSISATQYNLMVVVQYILLVYKSKIDEKCSIIDISVWHHKSLSYL